MRPWPGLAAAQNCKRLEPAGAGQDDAARINQCLVTKGRVKLNAGTFLLYSPIVFPGGKTSDLEGVALVGKGMEATRLVPQSDCQNHWPFVAETTPAYQSVIQIVRSPVASVRGVEIDLVGSEGDVALVRLIGGERGVEEAVPGDPAGHARP